MSRLDRETVRSRNGALVVRRGVEQAVALSHNNVASAGMIAPHPTEVRVRVRHSFTEVKVRVRVRVRHSKLMAKHS